jgi:hypothetical protein
MSYKTRAQATGRMGSYQNYSYNKQKPEVPTEKLSEEKQWRENNIPPTFSEEFDKDSVAEYIIVLAKSYNLPTSDFDYKLTKIRYYEDPDKETAEEKYIRENYLWLYFRMKREPTKEEIEIAQTEGRTVGVLWRNIFRYQVKLPEHVKKQAENMRKAPLALPGPNAPMAPIIKARRIGGQKPAH